MENMIKNKPVFNLRELKSNKCYKIRRTVDGIKTRIYYCILSEKTEEKLKFIYAWDKTINEIQISTLEIDINDIEYYEIEVIK